MKKVEFNYLIILVIVARMAGGFFMKKEGLTGQKDKPFENTPEYRGEVRRLLFVGKEVTLVDGRKGRIKETRGLELDPNLNSGQWAYFNPEIWIEVYGEEDKRSQLFTLSDIEGFKGPYGSTLRKKEEKD